MHMKKKKTIKEITIYRYSESMEFFFFLGGNKDILAVVNNLSKC